MIGLENQYVVQGHIRILLIIVFTHFSVNSTQELWFVSVADHMAYKFDYALILTIGQCHEKIKWILMKVENYLYFHIFHLGELETEKN